MNSPQKPGLPPASIRALRLELLIRAHEIARLIDERVRRVLDRAEPPQARSDSRTEPADASPRS